MFKQAASYVSQLNRTGILARCVTGKFATKPTATGGSNSQGGSDNSKKGGVRLRGLDDMQDNFWDDVKTPKIDYREDMTPKQSDIVIVGGGIMGWSTAYWLRHTANVSVTVIERDPSYTRSSTVLSVGGIRQQFSEPENIQMSLFGAEFLRNVKEHLSVLGADPPDIQFSPQGYLILATARGADQLKANFAVQEELGAKVELLSKEKIKKRWPWIHVDDIEIGCYGFENEGWFDPWQLLNALRRKAHSLGVNYVVGEVVGFESSPVQGVTVESRVRPDGVKGRRLRNVLVRQPDKDIQPITFSSVVNAAGPWASEVARMADIGDGSRHGGSIPLPVEPRLQHIYTVAPSRSKLGPHQTPSIDCPFVFDPSGLRMKRQNFGGDLLVFADPPPTPEWRSAKGRTPPDNQEEEQSGACSSSNRRDSQEPPVTDLEVDYNWFDEQIWPRLAHRVPAMEAVKVRSGWAGYYDFNYVDQNLIIGNHPHHLNMYFCNGSSGHGIQHAIAVGRALSELILVGYYRTIDLTRLSFDRFYEDTPVFEKNII